MSWVVLLGRNSLDDVAGHLAFGTVVEAGSAGIRVAEEVLDVLKRDTLGEQVCGCRGPERVAA